jgi:hypothetical protein
VTAAGWRRDAALFERSGNACEARYAGRPQLGDNGRKIGRRSIGSGFPGFEAGAAKKRRLRHESPTVRLHRQNKLTSIASATLSRFASLPSRTT